MVQGKTVLIIHSEKQLADLLAGILQEEDLHVLRATDLAEAGSTFRYFEPDLVLVELSPFRRASPDARAMLAGADTGRSIPVLALVTSRDPDESWRSLEISGVVRIPVKSQALMASMRRHLAAASGQELAGDLGQVGITDLLTMFDMGKRNGRVELDDGRRNAWIEIRSGDVIDGGIDGRSLGSDVINQLLDWQSGRFQATFSADEEVHEARPSAASRRGSDTPTSQPGNLTHELSLPAEDQDYFRKLLAEPRSAGMSDASGATRAPAAAASRPASPAANSTAKPTVAPTEGSRGEQAAHQALTLLNTVASYASGFSEKQLLERKLEGVRQRLLKTHGTLNAFEVHPDATVGLRRDVAAKLESHLIVKATAQWLIAFSHELDRTFPGSMPRATLHILTETVSDDLDAFGFMKALGFGGEAGAWQ